MPPEPGSTSDLELRRVALAFGKACALEIEAWRGTVTRHLRVTAIVEMVEPDGSDVSSSTVVIVPAPVDRVGAARAILQRALVAIGREEGNRHERRALAKTTTRKDRP